MSLEGRFPETLRPAPRTCPGCGCDLWGARLCEVCGATDFAGEGAWVCFSCGQANESDEARCQACNKLHVVACPACGAEGFCRDLTCEFCGAARAFYPRIRRLLMESARPLPHERTHERAHAIVVLVALVAVSLALTLGAAHRRNAAVAAAVTAAGAAATAVWIRPRRAADLRS